MADVVTLELPHGRRFRPVAHLVLGGLATRLALTYDVLDDIQTALDELLERRGEDTVVTVSLEVDGDVLTATVGPFGPEVADELRSPDAGLGLHRVLETVVDGVRVDERDTGAWVALTKGLPEADDA